MRVLRDPQIISGFIHEQPVDELPALTHCGEALCCREHALPWHAHSGFEFLYLSRGVVHWQSTGQTCTQRMGDIFVAHPQEPHRSGPEANSENQHTWVGLRLEKLGPRGAALGRRLRRADRHLLTNCQEVEPILRAVIGQVVTMRPRRALAIRALLDAFVALMEQRLALVHAPDRAEACAVPPYTLTVQKAVAYLRQSLDRRVPLAEMAAAATALSVPHFCSQFHREVGVPPTLYHVRLRLEGAREALRQPAIDITTAALQHGFSFSQHFSTLFKRAFGTTFRSWQMRFTRSRRR